MTLDDYLDAAIERTGLKSGRDLCKHLGLSSSVASFWRTRRTWPRDDVMVRIAELAGEDPTQALLDLNSWRTEGEARAIYEELARKIAGTAATLAAALLAGHLYVSDAQAKTAPTLSSDSATVFILWKI